MNDIERKLKERLDDKAAGLDAHTLSRLRQAREQALTASRPWWRSLHAGATVNLGGVLGRHPVSLVALATLLMFCVLLLGTLANKGGMNEAGNLEMLEIMSLDTDLELVEELDFYHWLEKQGPGSPDQ